MRKFILSFLIISLLCLSSTVYAPVLSEVQMEERMEHYRQRIAEEKKEAEFIRFLNALAFSESRNNPKVYNTFGYIGKWQFGVAARKSTGFAHITYWKFVKNPNIWSEQDQEIAMRMLVMKNTQHLRDVILKYEGTVIKGKTITKSGILAAAHLAGAGNVKKYFTYSYNPKDAYGTSLEKYLLKFSGFKF